MTKEKDLLLKYLCMALPYEIKFLRKGWNYELDEEMPVIEVLEDIDKDGYINNTKVYRIEDIKPFLRPMSSMSEEEKDTYDRLIMCNAPWVVIDWLNKKRFDYHGLIKKGLAIEAPEGMYN